MTTTINPFFNPTHYLATHRDLIIAGLTTVNNGAELWQHYVEYGASEERKPNAWFDAYYYLTDNPDLNSAGFSAVEALAHYYEYGIHEGREFSETLWVGRFDAERYAQENEDVVLALGAEKTQLLKHYLSFGYAENRPGAGSLAEVVQGDNVIHVQLPQFGGGVQAGTVMNDRFIVDGFDASGWAGQENVINGLGGEDTVVFRGAGAVEHVRLRSIEKVEITNTDSVHFGSEHAIKQITLGQKATHVQVDFTPEAVVAGLGELYINNQAQGASFSSNGYQKITLNIAEHVTNMALLQVDKTNGSSFSVQLQGGAKTGFELGTLENQGSVALTHLLIDGSALEGALSINAFGELNNVKNLTIKGSTSAANTFTASQAIDTFIGGSGADSFDFTHSAHAAIGITNNKISAVDTILNFSTADTLLTSLPQLSLAQTTGLTPASATLEDLVTGTTGLTTGHVFAFGQDSYLLLHQTPDLTKVQLVKLVGIKTENLIVSNSELSVA